MSEESKRVIDMNYYEARVSFLKNESYCNSDLPSYFNFSDLLGKISGVIGEKLKRLPASGYLNLWIQRLKCNVEYDDQEKLCKQYNAKATQEIWNNSRLKNEFKNIIEEYEVVDYNAIDKMPNYITRDEVLLFHSNDYY